MINNSEIQNTTKATTDPVAGDRSDKDLLIAFVERREEPAFRSIVLRHAQLVMAVCRGILSNVEDAEDACQATFLVLAQNANKVRRQDSLAGWLYGVAYRICLKMRARRRPQLNRVSLDLSTIENISLEAVTDRHAIGALHDELNGLPEKYRTPLVMFYLEGQSREHVAQQLECTVGAIKGRLERGRQQLRMRLLRRGVTLAALSHVVLDCEVARASISEPFVTRTVELACGYSTVTAGEIIDYESLLADGSLSMSSTMLTRVACLLLFAVALFSIACGAIFTQRAAAQSSADRLELVRAVDEQDSEDTKVRLTLNDSTEGADPARLSIISNGRTPDDFILREFGAATADLDVARLSRLFLAPDNSEKGRLRQQHLREAEKDWKRVKQESNPGKSKVSFGNTRLIIRTDMTIESAAGEDSGKPMALELEITRTEVGWKIVSLEHLRDRVD